MTAEDALESTFPAPSCGQMVPKKANFEGLKIAVDILLGLDRGWTFLKILLCFRLLNVEHAPCAAIPPRSEGVSTKRGRSCRSFDGTSYCSAVCAWTFSEFECSQAGRYGSSALILEFGVDHSIRPLVLRRSACHCCPFRHAVML